MFLCLHFYPIALNIALFDIIRLIFAVSDGK